MVIFMWGGYIIWQVALLMALAQIMGAHLGSNLVINRGTRLIRPAIILATLAIAVKLLLTP